MSRALFLNQFGDLAGPNPKLFTPEGMWTGIFSFVLSRRRQKLCFLPEMKTAKLQATFITKVA